jgi:hypothetical protein
MKNTFWDKYKVLIIGLLSAIATALTPFLQAADQSEGVKWVTLAYAVGIAVMSFVGNKLRGQGTTIAGLLGTAMLTAGSLLVQGGNAKWDYMLLQIIGQSLIAFLAVASDGGKTRGVENLPEVKAQKERGEEFVKEMLAKKP